MVIDNVVVPPVKRECTKNCLNCGYEMFCKGFEMSTEDKALCDSFRDILEFKIPSRCWKELYKVFNSTPNKALIIEVLNCL